MSTKEIPSPLPDKVKRALEREPLVLNVESVGRYFRNVSEVSDIQSFFGQRVVDTKTFSVGLTGSRLKGRFSYPAERLFAIMFYRYGCFRLEDEEELALSLDGAIPERFALPMRAIVDYLGVQQKSVENLGNIDLTSLPTDLRNLLELDYLRIPNTLRQGKSLEHALPHPAVFYPDIDLVALTGTEKPTYETGVRAITALGEKSGTYIQCHIISPQEFAGKESGVTSIISDLLEGYLPIKSE